MPAIACIVEGQGDVVSIPIILRRLAEREGVNDLKVVGPYRVRRQVIVRQGELERAVERAARSLGELGGVLVVLDADDDAACELGPSLAARARKARPDVPSRVVLATQEKEAWYLASLESLRGKRGVPENAIAPPAPEAIRGAKERLARLIGRPYSEITDQAAMAAQFGLDEARARARSFDKLWRDVRALLT